jgi:RNA polymerase sigma factor (sigma-70 family)
MAGRKVQKGSEKCAEAVRGGREPVAGPQVPLGVLTVTASSAVQAAPGRERDGTSEGARAGGAGAPPCASPQLISVAGLVEGARKGDAGAWEELVARFGGMIAATGRRFGLGATDVAEVQQTTWLRLVENLDRIEQPERIGGWLATTARRECLRLVQHGAKCKVDAHQMLANMADRDLPEPDARLIAEEREVVVRAALRRLKPRWREFLSLLVSDDQLGYKDISKLLKMPIGSIGPTRARCLEQLRRLVEDEGIGGL